LSDEIYSFFSKGFTGEILNFPTIKRLAKPFEKKL